MIVPLRKREIPGRARHRQKAIYVTALTIHLDDSGTHTTSRVATIGAWISRVPMWERFTTEWKRALEKHGIKKFHMAEFMANNQHSEFADKNIWNDEKKRTVLLRLTQITRKHTMRGLGFAVNVREYNSAIPEQMRAITGKYHYAFALRLLIGLFEQYRAMYGFTEPTEYIFDRMTKGDAKKEIETVFNEAEKLEDELHKYGIYKGCHSFRDKYDVVPLQASDMAAWLVNGGKSKSTE